MMAKLLLYVCISFFYLHLSANEINVYLVESPIPINWSSPRMLLESTAEASTIRQFHSIGHAQIEIDCSSGKYMNQHIQTGMTNSDPNEEKDVLFKQKLGMGLVFHSFKGKLESSDSIQDTLKSCDTNNPLNMFRPEVYIMNIAVSEQQCTTAFDFLKEYQTTQQDKKYGLYNSPFCGEGAGCATFASSILEVTGIVTNDRRREWTRQVIVPQNLIGDNNHPVDLYDILEPSKKSCWGKFTEGRALDFFDPNLMAQWVRAKWDENNLSLLNFKSGRCYIYTMNEEDRPLPDIKQLEQQCNLKRQLYDQGEMPIYSNHIYTFDQCD